MIDFYDLDMFSDEDIFWAVYRDDYTRDILAEEIRKIIPEMDKEDQVLFNDLNDNNILIKAHKDLFDVSVTVGLLVDNMYKSDVLEVVLRDHGLR